MKLVKRRADRRVRAAQADRRADGLPREAAAALRRVHPRPRSPRGVGAPQGARRSTPTTDRAGRTPSCCGTRPQDAQWAAPRSGADAAARSRAASRRRADPGSRPTSGRPSTTARSTAGTPARFVSATTLAHRLDRRRRPCADDPGLAKDGRDLELPPWNKGRYGTAIGRAVHAVLQTVDLATGAGLAEHRGRAGRGRRRARPRGDDRRA